MPREAIATKLRIMDEDLPRYVPKLLQHKKESAFMPIINSSMQDWKKNRREFGLLFFFQSCMEELMMGINAQLLSVIIPRFVRMNC